MNNHDIGQIELDPALLEQMNNQANQDVFLLKIAEIFKSAVLSFGVEANTADMAHKAFYAL